MTTPDPTQWAIVGASGQSIYGNTHLPQGEPKGVLILAHGFKGYKDYGMFPYLARRAAAAGLIAHRFNFSRSGVTHNYETFARPELFEQDTWGRQVFDLTAMHRAVASGTLAGSGLPIFWFGHSRGGLTALLTAARFDSEGPAGVIVAAAPHLACNFDESIRAIIREQGYIESPSSRTGQTLRIGRAWLDEIEADPDAFDPVQAIGKIPCPVLIVHGDADTTVNIASARTLASAASDATVEIIEGASHTFDCPNPLASDDDAPEATQRLAQLLCAFSI